MYKKNDIDIIRKVLGGSTSDFRYIVEKYKSLAYKVAFRILRNHEDAEEAAQDAFLKAFRSLKDFRGQSGFQTWLYRIVYNTAVSKTRKKSVKLEDEDKLDLSPVLVNETNEGLQKLEDSEKRRYIDLALSEMDETDSLVLTLFYLESQSVEEISFITDLTRSNVKIKLFRGRKHFYNKLKRLLGSELKEFVK